MTDQFPPPSWFPRPAIWPYWPSLRDAFAPPQPPSDPWNQLNAQWQPPPVDAKTSQRNDAWDRTTPAWLRSAMPPLPSGGILGSLPQSNDATDESATASRRGGILAQFDRWNDPQSSSIGRGILAPLERLNLAADQTAPAWLQSAASFAPNDGSLSKSIAQPWDNLWPQSPSQQAPTPPASYPFLTPPAAPYSAASQAHGGGTVAPPLQHLESANYWGAGPPPPSTSGQAPSNGFYLSPVPPAPSWDSVPTYPSNSSGQIFPQPPNPTSWGEPAAGVNAAGDSPLDEAALAQESRDVAAARSSRERRAAIERSASPALDTEFDPADPGWRERTRLNFANSYYRGTLLGSGHLAYLAHLASTPDEPGIRPEAKRMRDVLREEYRQAVADLARYDRMRSSGTAGEYGATALGQLGGAMLSPESWLGLGAKGATWLARVAKAGLQQGAISGGSDLGVQALNIGAGVQDQFDPARTGAALVLGSLLGGGSKAGAEAIGQIGTRWRLSPLEEIQIMRHNQAHTTLEGLERTNPNLSSSTVAPWVPQGWDNSILNQEVVKLRNQLGVRNLEVHHNFPNEYKREFQRLGIDPEEYTMPVYREPHRLLPDGLHTGPDNWNAQWKRFFDQYPILTQGQTIEHLNRMMRGVPWLTL